MKKLLIHIRTSVKFISVTILAIAIILGIICFTYKPTYAVTIDGEAVGYTKDKTKLQQRITDYIENGNEENVAFVDVSSMPEYKLCLLKKDIETNDDEIYAKVEELGTTYYKYYAILVDGEEKEYVASFEEAENAVKGLQDKNSANKDKLTIVEKYEVEPKDIVTQEEVISKLYEEVEVKQTTKTQNTTKIASATMNSSSKKVDLGISLIRPTTGTITSRFGTRWGKQHKGLDIGASTGTPIKAAASGTVTKAGRTSDYGNIVVISHGNGIETYYAHCSKLYVTVGQKVSQGEQIAAVGSTGRSTGPHLHLEIRVNGVAQNPQNYLY